jgi:calcium/calmodulin-dependent protein kinase I
MFVTTPLSLKNSKVSSFFQLRGRCSSNNMSARLFFNNDPNEPIDKYFQISDNVLGSGYFAKVYLGEDKQSHEKVAIKVIDKKMVEDPASLENEINIMKKVNHPSVVQMKAVFDTKEKLYIVLELMEGGELYDRIVKRKRFNEADAAFVTRQIFEALAYLHDVGVVHRDLKLENLLLVSKNEDDLRIKLADFGLSKLYAGRVMQTACGTPFYVAPDVLLGGGYGPSVDCWSAGVLLYVLLSGRLPFSADNDADLFRLIMKAELVFKSPQFDTVSETAKDLIRKLLVADPNKRLSAKQALQHPFLKDKVEARPLHESFIDELRQASAMSKGKLTAVNESVPKDKKDDGHKHHKKDERHSKEKKGHSSPTEKSKHKDKSKTKK